MLVVLITRVPVLVVSVLITRAVPAYRRGLAEVLLGGGLAVASAEGCGGLVRPCVARHVLLVRGVHVLLARHRGADLGQGAGALQPKLTVVLWDTGTRSIQGRDTVSPVLSPTDLLCLQ